MHFWLWQSLIESNQTFRVFSELATWQVEALRRASELQIAPESVNEGVGILLTVFGERWLQDACKPSREAAIPFRVHPIGNFLLPPGDDQIVHLLELIEYVKAAAQSPVFGGLIDGLKGHFGSTFLQLAFGYRFHRLGATGLEYEPDVQRNRKGDIAFSLDGRRIIAECYIPRLKRSSLEADWLLHQCLQLREGQRPVVLSMAIKLRLTPTAKQRKEIVRLVAKLVQGVESNIANGQLANGDCYAESDAAYISVARTRAAQPGEYSQARHHPSFPDMRGRQPFSFGRIAVGRRSDIRPGFVPASETRDHVAIWLSDEDEEAKSLKKDLDEPLADLAQKLERKLAQTKDDHDGGRLLIVSSWLTREMERASEHAVNRLKRALFEKHRRVAGLLLVQHTSWRRPSRPYYELTPVLPENANALSQTHLAQMTKLEWDHRVPPLVGALS